MPSIGEKIRQARRAQGLTQAELAEGLFDRSYLSLIENDKLCPPIETLRLLANRLNKPLSYFVASEQQVASQRFVRAVLSAMDEHSGPRAIEVLEEAVRVADLTEDFLLALTVRTRLISLLLEDNRLDEAFRLLSETKGLVLSGEPVDPELVADLIILEGNALFRLGRFSEAVDAYRAALSRVRGKEDIRTARISFNLGSALYREGNFVEALHYYKKGLTIARKVGGAAREHLAGFHHGMGICLRAMGQYHDAYVHTKEAYDLYQQAASPRRYEAKHNLGVLALEVGHTEEAEALLDECLAYYQEAGRWDLAASAQEERARLFLATARRRLAHAAWKSGLDYALKDPSPREFTRLLTLGLRSGFATADLLKKCEQVLEAVVTGKNSEVPLLLREPRPLDRLGSL